MATTEMIDSLDTQTLDLVRRMEESFEDDAYDETALPSVVASLKVLDQLQGLDADDNRVVAIPMLSMGLLFGQARIVTPDAADAVRQYVAKLDDDDETGDMPARLSRWFEIAFDATPDSDSDDELHPEFPYHPVVKGRTIFIRFLTDDEAQMVDFDAATTRADGSLIGSAEGSLRQF